MKRFILPVALALISLILILGSAETRLARASWVGRTVFYPFTHSLGVIDASSKLKAEIGSLRVQQAESTLRVLALQNQLKEYTTSSAIGFNTGGRSFETAEVIGYSGQFEQRNLMVSKGRGSGIKVGSAVVSANGIVGKVILVADTYSLVLPFSNPQFQIPVMDAATSVQGILRSELDGSTRMNMIKLGSEISTGDTIVTSNLSTLFPKGYPVGKVERIQESQDNLFISAQITPFTLVENLEHVFILKYKGRHEQE